MLSRKRVLSNRSVILLQSQFSNVDYGICLKSCHATIIVQPVDYCKLYSYQLVMLSYKGTDLMRALSYECNKDVSIFWSILLEMPFYVYFFFLKLFISFVKIDFHFQFQTWTNLELCVFTNIFQIKRKLNLAQNLELCIFTYIFQINRKLNFAQNTDKTLLHSVTWSVVSRCIRSVSGDSPWLQHC